MLRMKKVRIGIVGLGRLGMKHAENIAYVVKNAELKAICSINIDELNNAKKMLDNPLCFTDFKEMISKTELDAVVVVSSSDQHCNHSIIALERGLHVFCEKPLGVTQVECIKLETALSEHQEIVFMLGFMRRYDPSYLYAKQKIDEGFIGTPVLFRSYSVDPESAIGGSLKFAAQSAGQFIDMAVHDFDLARWMLKAEPKSIYAIGGCYAHNEYAAYGDGDNVSALMQFDNGSMVFILAGRTAPHGYNVETEIIGTKATLRIGSVPQKNMVEILSKDGVIKECSQSFQERFHQAFINELQEFVDCILEGRKPEVGAHDGTRATIIAELATKSFKSNELIKL